MKKVYIASKIENFRQVQAVRDALLMAGHIITYDWTRHGSVVGNLEYLKEVAENEREGVVSADVVIVLLPGGRGTHAELGMANALKIPVMLIADDDTYFRSDDNTCAFYWNNNVYRHVCHRLDSLSGYIVENIESVAAHEPTP